MAQRLPRRLGAAPMTLMRRARIPPSRPWPRGLSTLRTRAANPSPATASGDAPPAPEPPVLALQQPRYALRRDDVHCFLGVNGSGKSRLLQRVQDAAAAPETPDDAGESQRRRVRVDALSFDAHRAFVRAHGHRVVADVLGGVASPDARDLIVRLGLYPVWEARVRHLSTGELRKLMLAEALLRVPRAGVLVMDQPFDGLDKAARAQLAWMLAQLTRGFTRLLVETGARNQAFAYKTQVLLVANRLEHVVPEILTHVVLTHDARTASTTEMKTTGSDELEVRAWENPEQEPSRDAMLDELRAFLEGQAAARAQEQPHLAPSMSDEAIQALVQQLYETTPTTKTATAPDADAPALVLTQLSIAYGKRLLLAELDFERARGAHWALLGPNGSGKSSLMRVLMQSEGHGQVGGQVKVQGDCITVVSTDQHMEMVENVDYKHYTTERWLSEAAQHDARVVETVVQLLGIPRELLPRAFRELSQGEQKLVQIATAVARRPDVLLLDEITHGLDMFNRERVLRVVDALGRVAAGHTHIVLITHHEDEIVGCFHDVFEIHEQTLRRVE